MKKISSLLAAAVLLFFSSCGNKEKEATKDTTPTAVQAPVKAQEAAPMHVIVVQHPVKSYEKWRPFFDADDSSRNAAGLTVLSVSRGLENPNMIFIAMRADDVQRAKGFAGSPKLKEVMQKAGVTAAPTVSFLTVVRNDTTAIPQKERILVTHHVKDFDAWLKVYDAEGKDTRAANGLIDRGLARGIDDPNQVYILFAVGDMKKAQARFKSPELKKIMTDAGVEGAPVVNMFKIVDK